MIDLHIHTNFSDGTDTVEQVLKKIIKSNIKIFSITDHDTIRGCEFLQNNFKQVLTENNIKFVNGIEFSTRLNGKSIHILAYDFSINNKIISKLINEGQALRKQRTLKRIELLNKEFNIKLPDDELQKILKMENAGRPHLVQVLMKLGYAGDLNIPQEKLIKKAYDCIQKYMHHDLEEFSLPSDYVVEQLKRGEILSAIAHPLSSKFDKSKLKLTPEELRETVETLTKAGLSGLECYYSEYNKDDREIILKSAKEKNLLISAGSDYHGNHKSHDLGHLGPDISKVDIKNITILNSIKFIE